MKTKPNRGSTFHVRRCMFGVLLPLMLLLAAARDGFGQTVITRQPANLSLSIGASATFRVTATTTSGPITYQWRHQDTPLLNATNASLTLTNLQITDAGPYIVAVSDFGGTTNSAPAILDVDPTWTKITSDAVVTDPGYFATGAWADYNNDGSLDLLLVRIDQPGPNPLYRNNGDGTFTRVMVPSLQALQALDGVYCWGDYDNDGNVDLFVPEGMGLSLKNLLYHNNGDATFTRVTNSPVVMEGGYSSGGAWADYDRDGWLDLCVANGSATGHASPPPLLNSLYQNRGDGTFVRLTNDLVRPVISDSGYYDLPMWVDIDNDGWQDLFIVSTGSTYNRLYRNTGAGGFVKVTDDPLVTEFDIHWGDAAWADYDNDGNLDVFLTTARASIGLSELGPVALFRNDGRGHFAKMTTNDVGPLASERADTYVCCWGDYDNDGWLDLYLANSSGVGGGTRTDLLYHNNGDGTFTKVTRGSPVTELGASFGGWLVDLNNDGFLDLLTLKLPAPDNSRVRYYRNNGNSNNWLCVRCVGTASPRFATGTKVRVKATIRGKSMWQLRVLDPGGCANAQNFTAHFGLGDATKVDALRIEWTSGLVQELTNVAVKQYLIVTEPAKLSMPQPGELHIQCWKGMAYRIDGSPDLSAWKPLATVTNLTGNLQWADPDAPGLSTRFYRTVQK